jgi:photosystem II stability/assembly factor-like uncharacterized protein
MTTRGGDRWPAGYEFLLCSILICTGCASVGFAASPEASAWATQTTAAYPKKRDDILFVDRQTGFYGTGKGELYRTDDGGRSWRLAWQHEGTFIRSLGFVDRTNGFLGNLGAGIGGVTDTAPLYRTTDGGTSWEPVHLEQPIA